MCYECGCESVGSTTGIVPVTISDVSTQGNSGLNREGSSEMLPISGADESDNAEMYR
jgi:hypothetical protein